MKPANITLTKLKMNFIGKDGNDVDFDYIEIEVAPNLYAKINLSPSNQRVLQKYNPDLYQLIMNSGYGNEVVFTENRPKHLDGIYTNDANANML